MAAQGQLTESEIQQELSRLLASRQFADSPKLSRFLEYIVAKALAGQTDDVKEYSIGLAVFDRKPDFDRRLDTIVRVQASKLRSRLNEYYASEGASSGLKIALPRGTYVPVFEHAIDPAPRIDSAPPQVEVTRHRWWIWAGALAGLLATFAAGFGLAGRVGQKETRPEVFRFVVPPPPNARYVGSPDVSPDGRRLVCAVMRGTEADFAIYLHNLVTGAGEVLPGTAGGMFPSWSGDGKSIAFLKSGRVYRLDVGLGAEPVEVGHMDAGFGLDWNQGGVMLSGSSPGPIQRASLTGGGPAAVTVPARPDVAHVFPRFLPDGNHFLYLARNERPGESAIYAGQLDARTTKRILVSDSKAIFTSSAANDPNKGYLLFARSGELLAQPFDAKRLETMGAPRHVASGTPILPYGQSPFSTSRTGVLVYTLGGEGAGKLTWLDRTGNPAGELGHTGNVGDPVISPDGTQLAYDEADGPNRDIWTMEISSGKTTRITFDREVDHLPVWSSDGKMIVFESHRSPQGLYVAPSHGGGTESLLVAGGDGVSQWSADGRFLLFDWLSTAQEPAGIWLLPLTGDRKPRAWLRGATDPAVSPDGKWIAYVSAESGRKNVYVQAFNEGTAPGAGKWQVSMKGGSQPVWRRDGHELFYLSPENVLMTVAISQSSDTFQFDLPVPLFDTRQRVLRGPRNDYSTTDGKRFVFRVPDQSAPALPLHVIVNWPSALGN